MNINVGENFSVNIDTVDQKVELDYKNQPIFSESIPQAEQQGKNFFMNIAHTLTQFFMWIKSSCNCLCYSLCYSGCCKC
jgi:hypothetical protein